MFVHVIPLAELKQHSVTYWRPGRDNRAAADTWVVLSEVETGYATTVIDVPPGAAAGPEEVLALFLRCDD